MLVQEPVQLSQGSTNRSIGLESNILAESMLVIHYPENLYPMLTWRNPSDMDELGGE